MITVYRDTLPESYLLVVASDVQGFDAHALDRALHRAGRSGKQAVWLDCSLLAPRDVSAELGLLLCAYAEAFAAQGLGLVVAYAGAELQESLAAAGAGARPRLVNSLVDAPPSSTPADLAAEPGFFLPEVPVPGARPRRGRGAGSSRPGPASADEHGALRA